jgi:hypothetical protein
MACPLSSVYERSFDPGWTGEVFVCDIDRTYLYTRFSSLQGLAQIPFEFAVDKRSIEGMTPLLREIRRGPGPHSRQTPLYFISASPAQLRPVIQRKMLLDGLEFDGTVFKDWLGVLASLRLRRFREQLGFKLTALLSHRRELPPGAREVLIGDDLEADALTFALFADAVSRRIDDRTLIRVLLRHGVAFDDARAISQLVASMPRCDAVKRAYIRLERSSPDAFVDYWPHVAICSGAFQMAISLWHEGSISSAGVARVASGLREEGHSAAALGERLAQACWRGLVERDRAAELGAGLADRGLIALGTELPAVAPEWAGARGTPGEPWTPRRLLS